MILIHKRSEKLFCLALNRPPLVGKSSLWSATNPETELTKARRLLAACVSVSEWLWRPGSEADEMIENTTPQTCYLPCAKSHSDCHPLLGRVKLSSLSCPQRRKGKGWGTSGVFTGTVTTCKSNTNEGFSSSLVPGSLQNGLLTLQQHHGCKKSADFYGSRKDSGW